MALGGTIKEFLEEEGFVVTAHHDGKKALESLYKESFDLLILDVRVQKINGFELLKTLRDANIMTPAIFTTSLSSFDDLSRGYDVGGDDYLKKPFQLKELLYRIKAILKREFQIQENLITITNSLTYNINTKHLTNGDNIYPLNPKEERLLLLLLKHRGRCLSFDEIFEDVWSFEQEHSHESLRTYIKTLRKYLGKESIVSIKKQGYMFV